MEKLDVKYAIGYDGSPLHYVDNNLALGLCGNTLCCYSLSGGPNLPVLRGEGFGISAIAYSSANDWIAYAEKGLRPSVYVHDYKSQRLIAKLSDLAELEVCSLTFSKTGYRLLTCSSEPDFRLVLWDLETEQPVKLTEGQMKWPAEYASFSPANADHICVNGTNKIAFWTFEQSFKRISFTCKVLPMAPFRPQSHAWALNGEYIYVGGAKGEVLIVETKSVIDVNVEADQSSQVSLQDLIEEGIEQTLSEDACKEHVWGKHPEWKYLCLVASREKIVCICVGDHHIAAIGMEGNATWLYIRVNPVQKALPAAAEEAKPKSPGAKKDVKEKPKEAALPFKEVTEGKSEGPDAFFLSQLDLDMYDVTIGAYRSDGVQLVVGDATGSMVVAKLNSQLLQSLAHGYSPRSSRSMQHIAQVECRSVHHEGPILGIASLNGGRFVITCGEDGTLRVWDAERTKELSRQCFQSALTCIDSNEENNVLIVGSASGYLSTVKVDSGGRSAIIFRAKLHNSSLDKAGFNKNASHVVAVSKTDGRVFFLKSSGADVADLELLGFAILQDAVLAFAWDIPAPGEDLFVLLSLGRGEIVKLKVPTTRAPGGGFFFENKALRRISFRIAFPALAMSVGKYYLEKEGVQRKVLWAMGQDKKLQQYRLPDTLQAWTGPDAMPHTPHFIIPGHSKPGTSLFLSAETSLLVTGAEDGSLQIRTSVLDPLSTPQKVREMQIYDGYAGGLTCLTMAGGRIYTGGANGIMFICEAMDAGVSSRSPTNISPRESALVSQVEDDDPDEPTLVEKHEQSAEETSSLVSQSHTNEMRKKIRDLKQEFHEIFEKNDKAPELERLTRAELIVDLQLEKTLRKEGEKRVVAAQEEVKLDNLRKDLLTERIKQECWRTIVEPGTHLYPFIQGYGVPNFPMHAKHRSPNRLGKVAKLLRIVEMQETSYIQKTKFTMATPVESGPAAPPAPGSSQGSVQDGNPEEAASVANAPSEAPQGESATDGDAPTETAAEETEDGRAASSGGKSGSEQDKTQTQPLPVPVPVEEDEEEIVTPEMLEKGPIEALLYDSFSLTTPKRKRVQRLLLQAHLLEIRENFNHKMEDCRKNKLQTIEKIKEMHTRIRELQKYLGQKDDFVLPELNRTDNLKAIFEVKDEEISVPKPISEQDRLDAIKRAEEEALRLKLGGDAPERALMDMMGGKLELREEEDVTVEVQIETPPWMSGNPKTFTKEQIKELKEFEQKLKTMKEEREKKIRAQEAEMRKLKTDIQEIMTNFDASILELYGYRLQEEAKCVEVEQTIARLSTEIEDAELRDEKKEADLGRALDVLKASKGRSVSAVTEFKREVDDYRDRYEYLIQEDKALDRNFKKDFQDCGDVVGLLYKHFKKRRSETKDQKGSSRQSPQKDASRRVSLQKQQQGQQRRRSSASQRRASQLLLVKPPVLDPFEERPEDVEPEHWERLLAARNRKIQKEDEVKKNGETLLKMGAYLNKLAGLDDSIRKRIEKALRSFAEFRENREKKRRNLAFILHMKQGLVEVELKPLEEAYDDAVLLPRSIVEEFNSVILREANSKMDMFVAIKDFKRGIYDIQWEIRRHQVLQTTLAEKIRYIQLLRNTKALQKVIKNKDDVASASESVALENRLEHNTKLHEKKVAEKAVHLQLLIDRTDEIRAQNVELQQQAAMLHQEFSFQHQLCSKSLGGQSKDAALKEKISSINKKTKLRDLSKDQVARIVELKEELHALNMRAHPQLPQVAGS